MQPRHLEAVTFSAKAAISALAGALGYQHLHLPGSPWVAAVSAVIVTQPTLPSSLKASSLRVMANLVGALVGAALSLLIGQPLAAMAVGIMLTGLACYALKQDDLLRPAFVAVILVTLAGETAHWRAPLERVIGVMAGCLCAVVVGFLFDKFTERLKLRVVANPDKSSSQE
jgi:uncharacterized membrane protein YgaE (UPF0421/DUF939 family)